MNIQNFKWGYVEWIGRLSEGVNIGISNVLPKTFQDKHVHYGNEQFILVLEGEGRYLVNDEIFYARKGDSFYIPANATHATWNVTDQVLKDLVISSPIKYNSIIGNKGDLFKYANYSNNIMAAVEAMGLNHLNYIDFPFVIFDEKWNIIFNNGKFNPFCLAECNPEVDLTMCDCMKKVNKGKFNRGYFYCNNGLVIYNIPLVHNNKFIGSIRGGLVKTDDAINSSHMDLLQTTANSTVSGIENLLDDFAKSIISFCEFNSLYKDILDKNKEIINNKKNLNNLEKSLTKEKETSINLRINHHFLFNTLNYMASIALDSDNIDLYDAIIKLGKMFRYTSASSLKFVKLSQELDYLNTYLELQKLRYKDGLIIKKNIDERLMDLKVPINLLQPIVENAFIHGFMEFDYKKIININIKLEDEKKCKMEILNNGKKMDMSSIRNINNTISDNNYHGLSLIHKKLKSAYEGNFRMYFVSDESGTGIILEIPYSLLEEPYIKIN